MDIKFDNREVGRSNDGEIIMIDIPDNILIIYVKNSIETIVSWLVIKYKTILAPLNEIISKFNDYVLLLLLGDEKVHFISDLLSKLDGFVQHH